eukprot:COSAG05_NODE_9750_length_603_cov_7.690476_2_plen_77_part_00
MNPFSEYWGLNPCPFIIIGLIIIGYITSCWIYGCSSEDDDLPEGPLDLLLVNATAANASAGSFLGDDDLRTGSDSG